MLPPCLFFTAISDAIRFANEIMCEIDKDVADALTLVGGRIIFLSETNGRPPRKVRKPIPSHSPLKLGLSGRHLRILTS